MDARQDFSAAAAKDSRPSEVIYQVYPASFNDANQDGHGDLKGVTEKLDYIKSLGVDAVWISPFFLSPPGPEGDGGYAVTDYRRIGGQYGSMEDFQELLAQAHARGIRIYIDFVISHTAHDHEWFEKSRRREDPYTDYYVWHDGYKAPDGTRFPPNNWKSVFGGEAWSWDEERQQYYMHHFLKSQPKLNLNAAAVQDAVMEEMKFWLDMGVDGFRIDALPFATHDPQFRNNPWMDGQWPRHDEDWNQQRFEHSMCQPETVGLVARIRQLMDSYPVKKTTLGEAIAGRDGGSNSVPVAATYVDRNTGLDMCYTDAVMGIAQNTSQSHIKWVIEQIEKNFPTGGHCNSVGNHDSWRNASHIKGRISEVQHEAALRQLMRLFIMMPGSVCLYQGEELGLPQARIPEDLPVETLRDPVAKTRGPHACRDGSRTPMPWNALEKNAGFSEADEPYLPVPASHYKRTVDRQEKDPESMLNFMRRLINWRKDQPALVQGRTVVLHTHAPVLAFIRQSRDQIMLCSFNLSPNRASFRPSDFLDEATLKALGLQKNEVVTFKGYGSCTHGGRAVMPAQMAVAPENACLKIA